MAGLLCPVKQRFWAGRKSLVLLSPSGKEKGELGPPFLQSGRWFSAGGKEALQDSAQPHRLGMLALQLSIRRISDVV